jgi:cysteine-S-conjugate beta-lyase
VVALQARVAHGFFGYLTETPELPAVVAERVAKRYGWRVSPEAVVMLPGVNVANNFAGSALAAPGDGILLQTPAYPPILRAAGNLGRMRQEQVLTRDRAGRYVVDLDAFAASITSRTKVFMLCNPHNPVGRAYNRHELEGMAATCLARDLWIVADEIHCDLLLDGRTHVPMASLSPEIEARTVTFMAPSKTFNRDLLVDYVRTQLPGVTVAPPEATYLAWLDCRGARIPGGDPYTFFLERARVALNDGRAFGPGGDGFVRLNFGCPRALLTEGLDRMRKALNP